MDLTFEEIPEDLWEDWVWLVSPAGLMWAVEEAPQPLLSTPYLLTPIYTVNMPKMVLFHMAWSGDFDIDGDGKVRTEEPYPPVRMDADIALRGLLFLLRNYPLVLRWKLEPDRLASLAPNVWDDVLEPPEALWHVPPELEGEPVDLENISIEFFNPFIQSLRFRGVHRSLIGVVSPMRSIARATAALVPEAESDWREAMAMAIQELERRGLIEAVDAGLYRFTERGARMTATEPVSDCLCCRCRIEEVVEYELGGDED
ncbi:MAG TPA: hypothetical protein PKZ73_00860 [Methanomassiliicoccales archaeon]|nr:hypothetical protein [Methanomassiliicoccales archaeon]